MSFAFIVAASKSLFFLSIFWLSFFVLLLILFFLDGADKLGTYWLVWLILQIFLIAVLFVVVGLMIGLDNNDDITISVFFFFFFFFFMFCNLQHYSFSVFWKRIISRRKHNNSRYSNCLPFFHSLCCHPLSHLCD